MREVVKKEVLKLLKVVIIYPISDSGWVSPVQVVPKKVGMMVIKNEKMNSFLRGPSLVDKCAMIIENLTKPPGRIISCYPSLMKC
jgi:hypothetical protein